MVLTVKQLEEKCAIINQKWAAVQKPQEEAKWMKTQVRGEKKEKKKWGWKDETISEQMKSSILVHKVWSKTADTYSYISF